MSQPCGTASFLSTKDLQLGRGEPLEDTAKVISSMADAIVLRTINHSTIEIFAEIHLYLSLMDSRFVSSVSTVS